MKSRRGRRNEGGRHRDQPERWLLPRIEQRPVQERPVVVVPYKIRHLDGPGAAGGLEVSVNLNLIFGVPNIHQEHIEVKH